jgi:hypothetical protein
MRNTVNKLLEKNLLHVEFEPNVEPEDPSITDTPTSNETYSTMSKTGITAART